MDMLKRDLKVHIEDLGTNAQQREAVTQYCGLLSDYMQKRAHAGVLHTVQKYLPFALA